MNQRGKKTLFLVQKCFTNHLEEFLNWEEWGFYGLCSLAGRVLANIHEGTWV